MTRTIVSTEDESEIGDVLGRCRTLCGSKDAQVSTLPSLKTEDGSTAVTLLCSVIQEKKGELEYVRVASKSLKTLARTDDVVETMRQHNVVETAIFLLQDYCWDQEVRLIHKQVPPFALQTSEHFCFWNSDCSVFAWFTAQPVRK